MFLIIFFKLNIKSIKSIYIIVNKIYFNKAKYIYNKYKNVFNSDYNNLKYNNIFFIII